MKKTIMILTVAVFSLMALVPAYASKQDSPAYEVTANIGGGTPEMTVKLYRAPKGNWENIIFDDPDKKITGSVGAMKFDSWDVAQLPGKPAQWTSVDQFVAFVYASGFGSKYKIYSTATGEFKNTADASKTLPVESFACTPIHRTQDKFKIGDRYVEQGIAPSGSSVPIELPLPAIGTITPGYVSDPYGQKRIIQFWYSFPPYKDDGGTPYAGYKAIELDKTAKGEYGKTYVTITIESLGA